MVPWMSGLVSGLQNRPRRFESARHLASTKTLRRSGISLLTLGRLSFEANHKQIYTMRKATLLLVLMCGGVSLYAQVTSCASFMQASRKSDVVVPFRYDDAGVQTPIEWGLDLAWLSEENVRTGIFYVGQDMIDVIRLSYQPTVSVEDGSFSTDQITDMNSRVQAVKNWCKSDVGYYINDDNPSVDGWYNNVLVSSEVRAQRWAKVIDMTADYYKSKGLTNLIAISPFNEPDYYTSQGLKGSEQTDFVNICKVFKEDEAYKDKYADVRISGGNTLNTDYAYEWWNAARDYLDEGNTHQLAGSFDNYASFYETLTSCGHHATNDELHNVMECMVGVEYGMQTGIWWGTCENVRSQFMKATYHRNPGDRLAYAEHRDNWTSASVYRQPDGLVQAFGGMSERQSYTTTYDFVSLDRPVWYDGQRGRNYAMYLPGGTGYQVGQTSAEVCIDVQGGDDVMPHIDGTYKIVNVNSGMPMGCASKPTSGWTSVSQRKDSNTSTNLQWVLTPIHEWNDFSYYTLLLNTGNNMYLDILNWDYADGANVGVYQGGGSGEIEQWYLEYAGNGAFYIRSRYNAKCLEVDGGRTISGANVQMGDFTGEASQQWRFIATDATADLEAPAAPSNLKATGQGSSIRLTWDESTDKDIMEYAVVRNGSVIAKVDGCELTDNEAEQDSSYTYYVYAIDKSYNYSERSNEVSRCTISDERGEVMHLSFDDSLYDLTENGNHCSLYGDTAYVSRDDHNGISLSGTDNFIQLPYTIGSHDEMTISCWLYYRGGSQWQRVFDFGNGTDQYMFLTSNSGSGVRFAIKNGGEEEQVDGGTLVSNRWYHLAVTIGDGQACLYVNGELKGSNGHLTIKPSDIRPVLNWLGRSQYAADPLLRGYVDEFIVHNYALSAEEINDIITGIDDIEAAKREEKGNGVEYDLSGRRAAGNERGIIIRDGKKVLR